MPLPLLFEDSATVRTAPSKFTHREDSGAESSVTADSLATFSSHLGKMTHAAIIFRDGKKGNEKLGAIEEMQISLCSELVDQDALFSFHLISEE